MIFFIVSFVTRFRVCHPSQSTRYLQIYCLSVTIYLWFALLQSRFLLDIFLFDSIRLDLVVFVVNKFVGVQNHQHVYDHGIKIKFT